jgi:chromosome segregation ATPase
LTQSVTDAEAKIAKLRQKSISQDAQVQEDQLHLEEIKQEISTISEKLNFLINQNEDSRHRDRNLELEIKDLCSVVENIDAAVKLVATQSDMSNATVDIKNSLALQASLFMTEIRSFSLQNKAMQAGMENMEQKMVDIGSTIAETARKVVQVQKKIAVLHDPLTEVHFGVSQIAEVILDERSRDSMEQE